MHRSSKNESTHQENKHSFHIKRRVVLWKVTCRFTSNNVSFWKSDVLFLFERRVVLLEMSNWGWREKGESDEVAVTLVTAKKVKSCRMRARTRGKDTYSIVFWHCFVSAERQCSACILQGQQNEQTLSLWLFCKLCFSELKLLAAKTSLFRHFFPLWCNIYPYTYREMFRNLVMRGLTKTTTNCVNTNCRLNRMKWALRFQ